MIVVLSKAEKDKVRNDSTYARQMERAIGIAANNRALFKYVSVDRFNPMAQIVISWPCWRIFNIEKETENEFRVWEV